MTVTNTFNGEHKMSELLQNDSHSVKTEEEKNRASLMKAVEDMGERIQLEDAVGKFEDFLDKNLTRMIDEADKKYFGTDTPKHPSA